MVTHVKNVSKDEVADWAALYANMIGFNHLDKTWVISQMESMTDSLGSQKDCVIQLFVAPRVTLSSMEIHIEGPAKFLRLALSLVDLRKELINTWRVVLFLHKIKTNNHVRVFGYIEVSIDLTLHMVFTQLLQTASNDFHCEQWEHLSDLMLDSLENRNLTLKINRTLLIKDAAENMFPLDNCDHLLDQIFGGPVQDHLEKSGVVVQFKCHVEFWLEVFPDLVGLLVLEALFQGDGLRKVGIKSS